MPLTAPPVSTSLTTTDTAQAAIDTKHNQLGGDNGLLGPSVQDMGACPDNVGFYHRYKNGMIYWTPSTGAFEVHGSILGKWSAIGYERSPLGYPISDESGTPDGKGRFNRFQYGMIYWTAATGAFEVHGAILGKWSAIGYERSPLGYPISDETGTPDNIGRFNRFQTGMIYWTPSTGAFEVHGSILGKWASMGYERSPLGYPVSDEGPALENGRVSTFQHGQIYWWPDIGAYVNMGNPLNSKPSPVVNLSGPIVFPSGVAITSQYHIAFTQQGNLTISTHAHCSSEVVTYDYGIVIVVGTPGGLTLGIAHQGHVVNPVIGSAKDDDWNTNQTQALISNNWAEFSQASVIHVSTSSDTQIFGHSLNDLISQALQAIGKAALDLLVS